MISDYLIAKLALNVGGFCLVYFTMKQLSIAVLRDRIFEAKCEWFDIGNSPDMSLSFDSAQYRELEATMCGIIQYTNTISYMQLKLDAVIRRMFGIRSNTQPSTRELIASIKDDRTREAALHIHRLMIVDALHNYLIMTSPLFVIVMGVLALRRFFSSRKQTNARIKDYIIERNASLYEKLETMSLSPRR